MVTSSAHAERDAHDSVAKPAAVPQLAAAPDMSRPDFNSQFKLASARLDTSGVLPFSIQGAGQSPSAEQGSLTGRDGRINVAASGARAGDSAPGALDRDHSVQPGDNPQAPKSGTDHFDRGADVRLSFRGLPNTTPAFQQEVRGAVNDVVGQLNPQTQAMLKGLNVMTADKVRAIDPSEKHEPAALFTDRNPPYPNSIVFFQNEIQKRGITPAQVARHELMHPIDKGDRFSGSPEFKAAYDLGMSRIPADEKRALFDKFPPNKFPKSAMRAEFFADILATRLGNTPDQTGYAKGLVKYFPEAAAYLQKKFVDR